MLIERDIGSYPSHVRMVPPIIDGYVQRYPLVVPAL